jgi:hypothetical protein
MKTNIPAELNRIQNLLSHIGGQVIGEELIPDKIELSKDDREAWITYIVEMYEKKQPIPEPPTEMKIAKEEILDRIVKRALERALNIRE